MAKHRKGGRPGRKQYAVLHHPPPIRPEDVISFIEMRGFSDELSDLGLDDTDYQVLQIMLMVNPEQPLIPGGGGLRKMRFAPARWGTGKSGAARIGYAYYPQWAVIVFVIAYI